MHVLMLTHYFPPEIGAASHLTYELGETLVRLGNKVTVVTGMPSYNMKEIPESYRGRYRMEETMAGMRVLRIANGSSHGKSRWRRGLEHLMAGPFYALRALDAESDVDVVYSISPPIAIGVAAWLAARRFGTQYCLGVQDLFPQNAIDLGMMKNRWMIAGFEALERFVYRIAGAVTVHSEGNKLHVVSRGKPAGQVHTLPNWVDTEAIQPAPRDNAFRAELGLRGEFVVSFAGTMGWSQGLDVVIEAARILKNEPGLTFLMIGDGTERAKIGEQARGLANVRFLPMQPKEKYASILAASDACLVTLRPEVATPVVPSKLLTIMAAGRPVLASMPLGGDAPEIVRQADCGIVMPPGDPVALAEAIRKLKHDPAFAAALSERGRHAAEQRFSRPACVREFESVFRKIAKQPAGLTVSAGLSR